MEGNKWHKMNYGDPRVFPELPTTTVRCVGQAHYLSQRERDRLDMHIAFLVRDPRNPVDPLAVAVVRDDMRKVGYISQAKARALAPILDELGTLQIDCRVDGSRLWLNLPTAGALRKAAKAVRQSG